MVNDDGTDAQRFDDLESAGSNPTAGRHFKDVSDIFASFYLYKHHFLLFLSSIFRFQGFVSANSQKRIFWMFRLFWSKMWDS